MLMYSQRTNVTKKKIQRHLILITVGAVMAVIVWYLELQIPMQSVARSTTLCDKAFQWIVAGQWFSAGPPETSTNKTEPLRYNWHIVESDVKHHKTKPN